MKRKWSWESEDEDSENEEEDSGEEPLIQSVLDDLCGAVDRQNAKDLLHSMAASKNIIYWTPVGELERKQRTIPQSNIKDLLEYVLLPHNNDIPKPRAFNSFLHGLAELGINKKLVRNKKVLSDLLELEDKLSSKEKSDSDDDSDDGDDDNDDDHSDDDSDDDDDNQNDDDESESDQDDQEEDSQGSKDDQEEDSQGSNDDQEFDQNSQENDDNPNESCSQCENDDVKVHKILECPHCGWRDGTIDPSPRCSICEQDIPIDETTVKAVIKRCQNCKTIQHRTKNKNVIFPYE